MGRERVCGKEETDAAQAGRKQRARGKARWRWSGGYSVAARKARTGQGKGERHDLERARNRAGARQVVFFSWHERSKGRVAAILPLPPLSLPPSLPPRLSLTVSLPQTFAHRHSYTSTPSHTDSPSCTASTVHDYMTILCPLSQSLPHTVEQFTEKKKMQSCRVYTVR